MISITSRNSQRGLANGKHVCQILSVDPAVPPREMPWKDKTPQIKCVFGKDGEQTWAYYNTLGYVEFGDLTDKQVKSGKYVSMTDPDYAGKSFAVIKATSQRVISAIFDVNGKEVSVETIAEYNKHVEAGHQLIGGNSHSAQNIIAKLAFDSGIDAGESFTEQDLVGRTVGIKVAKNASGNVRVEGTFSPSTMVETEDVVS